MIELYIYIWSEGYCCLWLVYIIHENGLNHKIFQQKRLIIWTHLINKKSIVYYNGKKRQA